MLQRIKRKLRFACSRHRRDNKGFTLIEVIAVTIILGVMATMLLPSIDGAGAKARNAKLKNDLATLDQQLPLISWNRAACLNHWISLYLRILQGIKDLKTRKIKILLIRPMIRRTL